MFNKIKSIETDFTLLEQLKITNKNVLYVTRVVDKILSKLIDIETKQQTLDYYGKKYGEELGSAITSPQTDQTQERI